MPSDGTERRLPWKEAPVSGSAGLPAVMVVYVVIFAGMALHVAVSALLQ